MAILPHGFGIRRKFESRQPSPKITLPAAITAPSVGQLNFSQAANSGLIVLLGDI